MLHHGRHVFLLDAIDEHGLGQARYFEQGRRDVDHVMELAANLTLGIDAHWPMDDRAVASAAEVSSHLLLHW